MIPAPEASRLMDEARWTAPPDVQHALEMEILILVAEPSPGEPSTLRKLYSDYPDFIEQRNLAAEKILNERLAARFPKQHVFCKADLHDNGGCRFWLRVAGSLRELQHRPSARVDHNANLLKPHSEWVKPPMPPLELTERADEKPIQHQPATPAKSNSPKPMKATLDSRADQKPAPTRAKPR